MKIVRHLAFVFLALGSPSPARHARQDRVLPPPPNFERKYDAAKDETTVRLPRLKLGGENGKYHSLHSLVSYKHPGQTRGVPEIVTFELITVVKARRLKIDLHVQLLIDGEKVFLSSNRWAEKNPVPGRPWIAEHIALRMPYPIFEKIAKAKEVVIQLDTVKFTVGSAEMQVLRDFHTYINSN